MHGLLLADCDQTLSSPEGVGHAVGPQRSHHDELLQGAFPFPFLRKLLLLRTLGLHQLLPALGGALDVPIQTPKLISEAHYLHKR